MLETQKIPYALGIDVGSTTVKTVLLTEMGEVLSSSYERHFSKVRETVCTKLASLAQEYPDVQLPCQHHRFCRSGSGTGGGAALCTGSACGVSGGEAAVSRSRCGDRTGRRRCQDHLPHRRRGAAYERQLCRRYRCLYRPDGDPAGRERGSAGQNGTGSRKGVSHCFPLRRVRQV